MGETRKDERPDANQVGGAHGNGEGGPSTRLPNDAQLGGHGPGSLGGMIRETEVGGSGSGEGEDGDPARDRASDD